MNSILLPPNAPILIESTRSIGYTLEASIADIIDNSISAQASHIDIFYFPDNDPNITILDNGYGMNANELNYAMRYGSQNPNEKRTLNDLGRFGLGLKTASLSQCRTLTVVSKQYNHIEARRWDIDHVITTNDWSLLILESEDEINSIPKIEELKKKEFGTLVVWQNLDKLKLGELNFDCSLGRKMDEVRSHLSLVFHRYINGEPELKKIQIRMNNIPIEPADPFLIRRNTQVMADEPMHIEGSTVTIRPYILPHISDLSIKEVTALGGKEGLRKSQGFYVYRNKRLIVWGTWFRMMRQGEFSKLARVQVDIPNELDHLWTLDIKKSVAIPPEIVKTNLVAIIERLASKSKHTWEFRGKRETHDSIVHIWQRFRSKEGRLFYSINRNHPLVEIFSTSPPPIKRNIEMLLKTIETSIPLNQLYLDFTSEKRVENETELNTQDVNIILKCLLDQMRTDIAKSELLERLAVSDPFANYPNLIELYKTGGDQYGRN